MVCVEDAYVLTPPDPKHGGQLHDCHTFMFDASDWKLQHEIIIRFDAKPNKQIKSMPIIAI